MSIESVQEIIGRAIMEPEYRELLFSEPEKALKGYELTDDESDALKGLEREKFESIAGDLEERISRVGVNPPYEISEVAGFRTSISRLFEKRI